MRFRKIRRLLRDWTDFKHNKVFVSQGSVFTRSRSTDLRNTVIKMTGDSSLIIEDGAQVHDSTFILTEGSHIIIGRNAVIGQVNLCLWKNSKLTIGENCSVFCVNFSLGKGMVEIGEHNVLHRGNQSDKPQFSIADGTIEIEDHNNVKTSCWVRFGGRLHIGRYNCINEGSEIRCDESVRIGSYNMISYQCDIWDTNTHCSYSLEEKKQMFEQDFPRVGQEKSKPDTRPVVIGDGNWIGKRACILKGSCITDNVTVGTRAIVSNQVLNEGATFISEKGRII